MKRLLSGQAEKESGSILQTTIKREFSLTGSGLHSGRLARLKVKPAAASTGILFRRTDIKTHDNLIHAHFDCVTDTRLCTLISNAAGAHVSTIEHLMAALYGSGVYNALVEIDGPEIPILDGSSSRFVEKIAEVGVKQLSAPMTLIRILKPISVTSGEARAELRPFDGFSIDFKIDFPDQAIGKQSLALDMVGDVFHTELADCRTFCRRQDIEFMQENNLALGGSLDNAVVVDGDKTLNPEGFRRENECVRHKILDAVGDLALAGMPIYGAYYAEKAGHNVTNLLLRELFATPDAWSTELLDIQTVKKLPSLLSFEGRRIATL